MKGSYIEVLATRDGPDHALAFREDAAKRWTGVRAGQLLSLEISETGVPTWSDTTEGNIADGVFREPLAGPAGSENLCMRVISSC
jgi:hypothetical protein